MFTTLQDFVAELERRNELKRIAYRADPHLEITEIADRVMKAGGPALLFEHPRGHDVPLLINTFGSYRRMSAALGVESLETIAERLDRLVRPDLPRAWSDYMNPRGQAPKLLGSVPPRRVKDGPCKEVIERDNPSLDFLP